MISDQFKLENGTFLVLIQTFNKEIYKISLIFTALLQQVCKHILHVAKRVPQIELVTHQFKQVFCRRFTITCLGSHSILSPLLLFFEKLESERN